MIYGVLLSIPAKFVTKYEDEVRKTIGYGIARGDIISFTEARYKGDVAFVMLARSNRAAERIANELKELPINVRVIEIEGES
jgi:class 3 adenylate cyclase